MSRFAKPRVLWAAWVLAVAAFRGIAVLPVSTAKPSLFAAISRKYAIQLEIANEGLRTNLLSGQQIAAEPFSSGELRRYGRCFENEFNLYPTELIGRVGLKKIVFCKKLSLESERRAAIPDFSAGALYLDINPDPYYPIYLKEVLHHEFYHMVDFRQCGLVDELWAALNPADFKYGGGGKSAQGIATTSLLTGKYPGFLNHYSTTAVEEDKAEIFARLIVVQNYVRSRAATDEVLAIKIDSLKRSLERFCPGVAGRFWEQARTAHKPTSMMFADLDIEGLERVYLVRVVILLCVVSATPLPARWLRMPVHGGAAFAFGLGGALWFVTPMVQNATRIWLDYARAEPGGLGFRVFCATLDLGVYAFFAWGFFSMSIRWLRTRHGKAEYE